MITGCFDLKVLLIWLGTAACAMLILFLLNPYPQSNYYWGDFTTPQTGKAHMHTLQTIIETYRVEHGRYPETVEKLKKEAKNPSSAPSLGYWKNMSNPYTPYDKNPIINASSLLKKTDTPDIEKAFETLSLFYKIGPVTTPFTKRSSYQQPRFDGKVIYDFSEPNRYYLYGVSRNNILENKGAKTFILTNSWP